jgi:hypothetical protein
MTAIRNAFVLVAMALAAGHASGANLVTEMYDPKELTRLQANYSRGWLDNFNNVFLPAMTPEERAGVGAARFRMELTVPEREPFGFYSDGETVTASAASIKFWTIFPSRRRGSTSITIRSKPFPTIFDVARTSARRGSSPEAARRPVHSGKCSFRFPRQRAC